MHNMLEPLLKKEHELDLVVKGYDGERDLEVKAAQPTCSCRSCGEARVSFERRAQDHRRHLHLWVIRRGLICRFPMDFSPLRFRKQPSETLICPSLIVSSSGRLRPR